MSEATTSRLVRPSRRKMWRDSVLSKRMHAVAGRLSRALDMPSGFKRNSRGGKFVPTPIKAETESLAVEVEEPEV